MSVAQHTDRCVSIFRKPGEKGHVGKSLRKICGRILDQFPYLSPSSKICSSCFKKFQVEMLKDNQHTDVSNHSISSIDYDDSSVEMDVDTSRISDDAKGNLKSSREQELEEMLNGLKEKFNSLDKNDPLRLRILTASPSSWSIRKIAKEFNTSRHLASKSKELKAIRGVLGETTKKCGKSLPQTTVDKVIEFYTSDLNSRMMPGMKDVVSVKNDGKRTLVQKRLLLLGLKELYALFKKSFPEFEISFSTFAKLKPKNCILAGAPGTHSVCVCTIHQNVTLMLDAIDIEKLTKDTDMPIKNYKDCLNKIICQQPSPDCWLDNCKECPGSDQLSEKLNSILQSLEILEVQCSVWAGTDRSTLLKHTLKSDDFVDMLCTKLRILKSHSFIAKEQSNFIAERKVNLCKGEVIVMFDFSENYSYVCQDASQAFHFNNNQCTVFNVIYYWKENDLLMHKSNVFLSPSLKHDTAAVYTVQKLLIPEIRKAVKEVKKVTYVTDGAKQHFKNRYQIANLIHHKEDFSIEAEWHYSATAHGKSAYDGIGATFKREAYRNSLLAKPGKEILTSEALFAWAKDHFQTIGIFYFSQKDHDEMRRKLNKRFQNAPAVPEINKNHGVVVCYDKPKKQVLIKRYSNAKNGDTWWPYGER